jgi:gliding motility-associated-like protein
MRKLLLFIFLLFTATLTLSAQFYSPNSVRASQIGISLNKIDEVFFYNGTSVSAQITYTHTNLATFKWYKYTTSPGAKVEIMSENNVSSSTLSVPADGTGYILEVDGITKYFWVIEMNNVNFSVQELNASNSTDPCSTVKVTGVLSNKEIYYYNSLGIKQTIPRDFTISYNTLDWNGTSYSTVETKVVENNLPYGNFKSFEYFVPAPLISTTFSLSGDQILDAFNASKSVTTTVTYTPVAVAAHLQATISERESTNERDRTKGTLSGSAPLVVDFKSNSNTPVALYTEWYITSTQYPGFAPFYQDKDLHYTFQKSGLYKVKMIVRNAQCEVEDSVMVTVLESELEVPNVFTPNGDGKNDEFRVAYRSLTSYHCIVFNRWGRIVYEGSDPGKGWDGRIGGKLASPGPYYYIIEATGSDVNATSKKPIRYKKKGDINLLR